MCPMPTDWKATTLGEICQQQGGSIQTGPFGSQLHASDYTNVGIPVVMPVNLVDGGISEHGIVRVSEDMASRLARHRLKPDDIVFSRRGDVTRFARVSERETGWLCGTGCLKVSVGKSTMATSPFIAAVLASPESKEWLVRHAVGATMPNLNTEILGGVPVTLPLLAEQHAIAHILGTLDDRIDNLRQTNTTLEAMAQALFKSWFVDFDGVPQEGMQESELGLIPKGWRVGMFGDVAEHQRRTVQPEEIEPATPYIALEHMPKRCIALSDWGMAAGLESNKHLFKRGEILFGKLRPYFHKVGIAPIDGVCSTDIVVIAPKSPNWFGFVLAHASSNNFVEYTNAGSTGTKMPRTSWSQMSLYAVALPPESVAATFNSQIQKMAEKIISNIHVSCTLAQLRDTLLPRLISGKLRIHGRIHEN